MDLCVMKIKIRIIPLAQRIGYIENARLRFKSQSQAKTQKDIIKIIAGHVILRPSPIQESK